MKLSNEVVVSELDGVWVVFDSQRSVLYELNDVGGFVMKVIQDGVEDIDKLIECVVNEFDVAYKVARKDVVKFVNDMFKLNLLSN